MGSFVILEPDIIVTFVIDTHYKISCCIGSCYNGSSRSISTTLSPVITLSNITQGIPYNISGLVVEQKSYIEITLGCYILASPSKLESLTHWGRDKMDAISQTTFSKAFSWMKMFEFGLKFHWSLFPRVQLAIFQHWFRQWLGAVQATSHYLNQWW